MAAAWARAHPALARAALAVPAADRGSGGAAVRAASTLEQYLEARGWPADVTAAPEAVELLSHTLTYPLTLARHLGRLGGGSDVLVLGARAEATLPLQWWAEIAPWLPAGGGARLRMLGPEIAAEGAAGAAGGVAVEQRVRGAYPHPAFPPSGHDAAVLFSPGLAHPKLRDGWVSALGALEASGAPVLVTGLGEADAAADAALLIGRGWSVDGPHANPFASRRADPNPEGGGAVFANAFSALAVPPGEMLVIE